MQLPSIKGDHGVQNKIGALTETNHVTYQKHGLLDYIPFTSVFWRQKRMRKKAALAETIELINNFWSDSCCKRLTFVLCKMTMEVRKTLPNRNTVPNSSKFFAQAEASVARACLKSDHQRAMPQGCGGNQLKKKGTKKKWCSREWLF